MIKMLLTKVSVKIFFQYFLLALLASASLLVGCSTAKNGESRPKKADTFDGIVRPPKEQIDVFTNGQLPLKPYKVIKILSEKSRDGREERMADIFVEKAKALGADGVIINPSKGGGVDVGPFGANTLSSYSATVFVYE